KVRYKHTENFLNHVNPYTKKRYAEEEAIAVFEVYNENGYLKWSLEQGYAKWPAYFRNKLQKLWNEYLKKKYTDDSGLLAAWGKLDDGESLAKNSVKLGPIIGERTKYPEIRGNDYVTFNIGLIRDFNEKFVAYCRGFAPKGVGINVVPFVHDTYYRNCVPWGYVDSFGDVNSFGMYQSTLTSSLSIPPSLYIVDNNTLADKPNMIYEINTHRPMPTRAEFPYRVAALASYQDWDAVFWHYGDELTAEGDARFMKAQRIPDELFTIAPMRYMTKFSPDSAICHSNDPIMSASMATAGHIFRHNLLAPAEKPKVYVVGKRDIFSYNGFNGAMINKSTFREGSRIKFDDKGDFGFKTEDGSPLPGNLPAPSPFLTGKEQIYDWANSRMMLDTPTLKAYVGETKNLLPWRFKDGIAISNLNQPFVAWSVSSDDGKALTGENASRRLLISVLSDARNFGFDMDWSIALPGGGFVGPRIQAEKIRNKGRAPVVYNEVGFTLYLPRKISGTLRSYDFALREFATQKITNSAEITAPNGHAFCYRLDIDSFGEASATPASAVPQKVKANSTTSNNSDKTIVNAEQFWSPVSVINWSLDSETAHRYLRESTLLFSNIAPIKRLDDGGTQIIVNELEVLFGSPATLELRFDMHHRMRRLSLSNFPKAPSFESSVAALTKVLGKPFSSDVKPEAFAHNKVVWKQQHGNSVLTVTLSEFQAYMSLVAELKTEK
ncbi:MAG: hypothetical protein LBM70_02735, partial [Victivallales bacterium]|nr:hypothetical protein [Victivallales bacterium]